MKEKKEIKKKKTNKDKKYQKPFSLNEYEFEDVIHKVLTFKPK